MNLNKAFPPSPYDTLADLVMLPRSAAKARAKAQGTLGEYIYPCPLDQFLLDFLQLDPGTFSAQALATTNDTLAQWIDAQSPRSKKAKDAFNNTLRHLKPDAQEKTEWFDDAQKALGRDDYFTFFDHLDADEGRF